MEKKLASLFATCFSFACSKRREIKAGRRAGLGPTAEVAYAIADRRSEKAEASAGGCTAT